MKTYRELVYLVLDEIKTSSDDAFYTEDHVISLLREYRALILKQRYGDIRKEIPSENYQTICLCLEPKEGIAGFPCEGTYLKSTVKVPNTIPIGISKVYPTDYFAGEIALVNRDRFKYVGHDEWLQNIIYATIGPDNYLWFKSENPQYEYLDHIRMTAVFNDPEEAYALECEDSNHCDILDRDFPLEEALIPPVIELVVKELLGASYRPKDPENNATDDLADLANFLARNVKSRLQKQIES